ncbi:MAG: twin-arginine translocase TatA/TatE family subunit [Solirubrobacteraceae bacterium]
MELIVVLVLALVVLGPKRLPAAARSLGTSMRGFKDSLSGGSEDRMLTASDDAVAATQPHSTPSTTTA